MRLPKGLYEILPFLYVFAGLAVIDRFEEFTGYLFGLLLISVAGFVFLTRSHHRQALPHRKG